MDWIDLCIKKRKACILMIFAFMFSGMGEMGYAQNTCLINGLNNLSRWMKNMESRPACKAGILVPKKESSKKK